MTVLEVAGGPDRGGCFLNILKKILDKYLVKFKDMRFFGMMFQASGGGRKNDMSEISGRRYNFDQEQD